MSVCVCMCVEKGSLQSVQREQRIFNRNKTGQKTLRNAQTMHFEKKDENAKSTNEKSKKSLGECKKALRRSKKQKMH